MNRKSVLATILFVATQLCALGQAAEVPAFPGAEGWGQFATGGRAIDERGSKVYFVTRLDDCTDDNLVEGTLRWALHTGDDTPRTILFRTCGTIKLTSKLKFKHPNVSILGQSAPGGGICISGANIYVSASNVIIRHLRFRAGDEADSNYSALDIENVKHVILDHCSFSWSMEENVTMYDNDSTTVQWCIVSEPLYYSRHKKGQRGYGSQWGGEHSSFHHNLFAHCVSRSPRLNGARDHSTDFGAHDQFVDTEIANNVIYNWGNESTYGGEDGSFNIVGNYYKPGPASVTRNYFVNAYWYYEKGGTVYSDSYPNLYMTGNFHAGKSGVSSINADNYAGISYKDQSKDAGRDNPEPGDNELSAPLPIKADDTKLCHVTTHSAQNAYEAVLDYAGASLSRDDVDERIVSHAEAGTAAAGNGIIDSQEEVGGWPAYEGEALSDNDGDGMPDGFEIEFGLDPDDASDASAMTLDPYGRYTNIEMYLHYLVKDIVSGQNSTGYYGALD